jgi:hypothetical protein
MSVRMEMNHLARARGREGEKISHEERTDLFLRKCCVSRFFLT